MAIAGPRLDRPSAIGDEGRPRATSLWIASVLLILITILAGWLTGQPTLILSLGSLTGLTVAGIALLNRERFRYVFVGYVLFMLFGALCTFSLVGVALGAPAGIGTLGLGIALVGIGLSWANVTASEATRRVTIGTGVAYVTMLVALVFLFLFLVVIAGGGELLSITTTGQSPLSAIVWFLVVVGYAAGALRLAQWRLPTEQLVPSERRPAIEKRLRTVGRTLFGIVLSSVVVLALVVVVWVVGIFERMLAAAPGLGPALDALATPLLLGAIASVGTIAILAALATFLLRVATRRIEGAKLRVAAASAAGVCLAVLAVLSIPINPLDSVNALVSLLLAPIVLIAVSGVGLLAVHLGLIPDRSGAPAVAAAGLVLAALGYGTNLPELGGNWPAATLVFACVAGAAIVWDLSWYGLGITAELGHIPETRRMELFHGVVVIGVGLVSVALLTGLEVLRSSAFGGIGGAVAVVVAGAGALLLLLPLRG